MRSYYNPATRLRKGEKPLTALERLNLAVSKIDLAGLSAATEKVKDSMSAVSESLKQVKIPEIGWDEVHVNLGSFDTKEEAEAAAVEKVKELAEGGVISGELKYKNAKKIITSRKDYKGSSGPIFFCSQCGDLIGYGGICMACRKLRGELS